MLIDTALKSAEAELSNAALESAEDSHQRASENHAVASGWRSRRS